MTAVFPHWAAEKKAVKIYRNWRSVCHYFTVSSQLLAPGTQAEFSLNLFESAILGQSSAKELEANDIVFYVGGPAWCLDWLPDSILSQPADVCSAFDDCLAVGVHSARLQANRIGQRVSGEGVLQLWRVGVGGASLACGVVHDGGVVWDCKWCPAPAQHQCIDPQGCPGDQGDRQGVSTLPRMGLLAAALGNGRVVVFSVPKAHALREASEAGDPQLTYDQPFEEATSSGEGAASPLLVSLEPVASFQVPDDESCLPNKLDWLPTPPHDLLLVGCWDGSALVLHCQPGATSMGGHVRGLELLTHISAERLPLRALGWAPPHQCSGPMDATQRSCFFTAGQKGSVNIWDMRDPHCAAVVATLQRLWVLCGLWLAEPHCVVVGVEDGTVRMISFDAAPQVQYKSAHMVTVYRGKNLGAVWGMDHWQCKNAVAYGGEDGEVLAFVPIYTIKYRLAHVHVGGLRKNGSNLHIMSSQELRLVSGGFNGREERRVDTLRNSRVADEQETIFSVRWSQREADSTWLAHGGVAGLVRCQKVTF